MRTDKVNLLVVDTETTGSDVFVHDILSFAFVPLDGRRMLDGYVRVPDAAIWSDYANREFPKYSKTWSERALRPVEALKLIESYIFETFGGEPAILAGHNIAFDRFFLQKLARTAGASGIHGLSHRTFDTHTVLMALAIAGDIPMWATTSDGAFDYFSIKIDSKNRHTALGDAIATRELILRLIQKMSKFSAGLKIGFDSK